MKNNRIYLSPPHTSTGSAAMHLALKLVGVKENDIVLCPSLTFSSSANVILYEKATPVFVDITKPYGESK